MEKQNLVDLLIAYWTQGPSAVDEEGRRICREVAGVLARSMSGVELLDLQEAPEEHRQEIEARVGVWLAMTGLRGETPGFGAAKRNLSSAPPPAPVPVGTSAVAPAAPAVAPAGVHLQQTNDGGINFGNVGNISGGVKLAMPAPSGGKTRDSEPGPVEKTRILFLGANPAGSTPLRLDEEVHAIDRALATATLGSRCELSQKWAVRVSELQEHLLRAKPNVVHFSGHGSADRTIAFQGEDGMIRPVAADRLARLLSRFNQRLRCVVLNACYTKLHGEAIAEHIDCVVGMSTAVGDPAAIRFAAAFYQAVGSGCSVGDAFEQACADIELGETGEDATPSLLAPRCDPNQVFLVKEGR